MGYKQFKNTLDLSNKTKTEIIREVIMEPRSLKVEILKVIAIIMIVTAATWSITKANEILNNPSVEDIIENYSIIGIISEIDDDYVTLTGANVSTGEEGVTKTIYIAKADKIEDPEYRVISLDNLLIGETIILQGRIVNNEDINIERVINFGVLDIVEDDLELASTTDATSTLDVTEASSTNATNTNATSTATSTTTDDGADSSFGENTDSVIEAGATTTEEIIVATTTTATSTDDEIVENSTSTDTSTTTSTSTTTDSTENETDTDEASSADETIDEPTTETSTTTEEVSDDTPEETPGEQSTDTEDTTDPEDSVETQTEEDPSEESLSEDTESETEQTEEVQSEVDQGSESYEE